MGQGSSSWSGENWSISRHILKVKPNEFPNGLDVGYASKSGIKNESRFLASEMGRIKLQLSKKEKAASRTGFSGKTRGGCLNS